MRIIYWTSTSLVGIFLLWSAYSYLFNKSTIEGIKELGFPDFFRIQLAVLKLLAVILLLIPSIPAYIKEWAYAGVILFLITAITAHIVHKDPIIITAINAVLMIFLLVSHFYWYRIR